MENLCTDVPEEFYCPITNQVMRVPFMMPDTYTYEKEAIEKALKIKPESPFTKEPMKIEDGKINHALLRMIENFRQNLRPQVSKKINVILDTIDGKKIICEINPHISVEELKQVIHEKLGIAPREFRIIHCAKQLDDSKNIDDYNIQDRSILHILMRLRGG